MAPFALQVKRPADPQGVTLAKAGGGAIVCVPLTGLPAAVKEALDSGLTPLIIDRSKEHVVDSFYSYSGLLLDAKKMALEHSKGVTKDSEVLEGPRKMVYRCARVDVICIHVAWHA